MIPAYLPILKALQGEYEALAHLDHAHANAIHPLFDVPVINQNHQKTKKYQNSPMPVSDYLDGVARKIGGSWKIGYVMVDMFNWRPSATVETGEQALAYLYAALKNEKAIVIPVVGYDRWDDPVYRLTMTGFDYSAVPYVCLRLEAHAIEDALEPELFHERMQEILDDLELTASKCSVLIDFGDMTAKSLIDLTDEAVRVLGLLDSYGFHYIATAGCSMPNSINQAVKHPDNNAQVVRKEMLLWQTLRTSQPGLSVVYGDYGVRGPGSNEGIRTPHANAKIRYTVDKAFLVARGHSVQKERYKAQMPVLAREIVTSKGFISGLTWGDYMIAECSMGGPQVKYAPVNWIAYDTNHHLGFVVEEIREFEHRFARPRITDNVQ